MLYIGGVTASFRDVIGCGERDERRHRHERGDQSDRLKVSTGHSWSFSLGKNPTKNF